jgi:hypothetical protein
MKNLIKALIVATSVLQNSRLDQGAGFGITRVYL